MSKPPVVVVDADALIAQTNPNDLLHEAATEVSRRLVALEAQVIYPTTAVAEATTHIQRVLSDTASAYRVASVMADPAVQVAEVNQKTLEAALAYFGANVSKKHTLFDCIVAAVARQYAADAIFSFDKFYKSRGFRLASEL